MRTIVLKVGDVAASNQPDDELRTYALGSCVAVLLYDTINAMVSMVHIAMPDSSISWEHARLRPGHFADTGIPMLFKVAQECGCRLKSASVRIKLVGGANIMDPNNTFNIGKRNLLAIKKILWGHGRGPIAEDTGGQFSRTVSIVAATRMVQISSPGRGTWTI